MHVLFTPRGGSETQRTLPQVAGGFAKLLLGGEKLSDQPSSSGDFEAKEVQEATRSIATPRSGEPSDLEFTSQSQSEGKNASKTTAPQSLTSLSNFSRNSSRTEKLGARLTAPGAPQAFEPTPPLDPKHPVAKKAEPDEAPKKASVLEICSAPIVQAPALCKPALQPTASAVVNGLSFRAVFPVVTESERPVTTKETSVGELGATLPGGSQPAKETRLDNGSPLVREIFSAVEKSREGSATASSTTQTANDHDTDDKRFHPALDAASSLLPLPQFTKLGSSASSKSASSSGTDTAVEAQVPFFALNVSGEGGLLRKNVALTSPQGLAPAEIPQTGFKVELASVLPGSKASGSTTPGERRIGNGKPSNAASVQTALAETDSEQNESDSNSSKARFTSESNNESVPQERRVEARPGSSTGSHAIVAPAPTAAAGTRSADGTHSTATARATAEPMPPDMSSRPQPLPPNANSGAAEVRVNLRMGELGKVEIRTAVNDSRVTANVSVENNTVRSAVVSELGHLHSALGARELQLDSASVVVAEGRPQFGSHGNAGGQQSSDSQGRTHFRLLPKLEKDSTGEAEIESNLNVMV